MIPTTWLAVLLFLITVSPGMLFDLLGARRRVGTAESAFREISRIALGSLAFTGIATLVLVGVRAIAPQLFLDPRGLILGGNIYLADHYTQVLAVIAAEAVVAHALAFSLHKYFARRDGETIRKVSAWSQAFKHDVPAGHAVYARVRLTDGVVYTGQVAKFSADLPLEDRELLLAPPLASKIGTGTLTSLPATYQRVIIRGPSVDVVAVEYRQVENVASHSAWQRWRLAVMALLLMAAALVTAASSLQGRL